MAESVNLSSGTDHRSTDDSDDDRDFLRKSSVPKPSTSKRARVNIVTPQVTAALDRAKVSDRKAALLLTTIAQGLGHNTEDLNINCSSIRRKERGLQIRTGCTPKERV